MINTSSESDSSIQNQLSHLIYVTELSNRKGVMKEEKKAHQFLGAGEATWNCLYQETSAVKTKRS